MIVLFYLQQRAQKSKLINFKTVKTRLRNFIFYFFIYRDWTNSYLKQYEHMLRTSITRSFCIIGNEKIVFNEDLRLEMCLQDISAETREQFLERTIENLLSFPELIHTLRLFIDYNQSYKQTAKQLHIHINTLHYRLKKIEEHTGLDPKQFKDLNVLYFALLLLDDHTKRTIKQINL